MLTYHRCLYEHQRCKMMCCGRADDNSHRGDGRLPTMPTSHRRRAPKTQDNIPLTVATPTSCRRIHLAAAHASTQTQDSRTCPTAAQPKSLNKTTPKH